MRQRLVQDRRARATLAIASGEKTVPPTLKVYLQLLALLAGLFVLGGAVLLLRQHGHG
jgi:hypothetical protein